MTVNTSICARYKFSEGWHIFDSDELPGLYVASRDPEQAFKNVAQVIEGLFKLDHGVEITVVPEMPVKEFLSRIASHDESNDDAPLVMSDRRFHVVGALA